METKRILTIIGTRPEAIKLAPVVRELMGYPDRYRSLVCVTGQHRELLDQALEPFDLQVDEDLDIMQAGQTPAETVSRAMEGLGALMDRVDPDFVLVQGDTTTTFCGALAGFYHDAPVGHVEAGLRTGERRSPFPEEMNRRMVTQLADLHFAPTADARSALLGEGVDPRRVLLTGNPGIDALLWMRDRLRDAPPDGLPPSIRDLPVDRPLLLVTGHRRESFGPRLEAVCRAIRDVTEKVPELSVVYPVHPNPNVLELVHRVLGPEPRIHLVDPLPYAPFVWLLDRATVVVSDSGGVQEEAPALGTPVLVTREHTERPEAVASGNALLVGHDAEAIAGELTRLLLEPAHRASMEVPSFPFGDGQASSRIVAAIDGWFDDPARGPAGGAPGSGPTGDAGS